MKPLIPLLLASILLSACAYPVEAPAQIEPDEQNTGEGSDEDSTPVDDTEIPEELSLQVGLIALEDNGENGPLVGCGDSLVFVTQTVSGPLTAEKKVRKALEALFAIKEPTYGESGLYTALDEANLTIDSVELDGTTLKVALSGTMSSGGVCDDPRIVEQIKETAENNVGLDTALTVMVTVNGNPLEDQLSGK